jgi:CBS domain-containing protein
MRDKHVGEVIIVKTKDRKTVGILTDRDIVTKVVAGNMDPDTIKVEDIMAKNPTVAKEQDGLFEVAKKLERSGIRRIPVTDTHGRLTGLVSIDDLYELFAAELQTLARVASREVSNERLNSALVPQ